MTRAFASFALERVAAGDAAAATADAASAGDELAALRDDDDRTLRVHPPARVAAEIARRRAARARARVPSRFTAVGFAFAAVACALAFVIVRAEPSERAKGSVSTMGASTTVGASMVGASMMGAPSLSVWRQRGDDAELLTDGARVRAGDVVQLTLERRSFTHGVVVALDGAGHVSLVWPLHASDDTTLPTAGGALDFALEIDDAPGFERFVLVGAHAPLDVGAVLAAARDVARTAEGHARALDVERAGASATAGAQTSVTLVKETR